MNGKDVTEFLGKLENFRFMTHTATNGDIPVPNISVLPENIPLFHEMFELAKAVEPYDWFRGGEDRYFWIRTEEDSKTWFCVYLAEHNGNRGLYIDDNRYFSTDTLTSFAKEMDISPLLGWIIEEEKKAIKMIEEGVYTDYLEKNLPYQYRSGYTDMATYWKYFPKHKERLFGKIDAAELEEYLSWDDNDVCGLEQMSSADYFDMCCELYDVLELKEKYPMHRADNIPMTSKDYYKAYSAMYGDADFLVKLDETSNDAFRDFVNAGYIDHTWEVCLVPDIELTPRIIDNKFYMELSFYHGVDDYDKLIHICLEMKKKGYPILKPKKIEERMRGDRLVRVCPEKGNFDERYARRNKLELHESCYIPEGNKTEIIQEIKWFPVGEWRLESAAGKIKIGCPRCGCDKEDIIYQNSGPIVRIWCPKCKLAVDDEAVVTGHFKDIFRYWNWMSSMYQIYGKKNWEE